MKPQPLWYESTGREDSTPGGVEALGSVREGRRTLVRVKVPKGVGLSGYRCSG
jgi:hypothetical protein